MIINCISYVRIKANYTFFNITIEEIQSDDFAFSNNNQYYYIFEKGKVEMYIDDTSYLLERESTISTKALVKNTKTHSYLKTLKRVYLYQLPLDKYTTIFSDFVDKMQEEKVTCLKQNFIFQSLDKKQLIMLSNGVCKLRYTERKMIIEQDSLPNNLYLIITGKVLVLKNQQIVRKLQPNEVFGEMTLFTQMESYYSYYAEKDTDLYQIEYKKLEEAFSGENYIKNIILGIFSSALKNSQFLSNYFNPNNIGTIFNVFQLKYYFNDPISSKKTKKLFILLGGFISKSKQKENFTIPKGEFYEPFLTEPNQNKYFSSEECVIFEAQWNDILKSIQCYSDRNNTMFDKMFYIRKVRLFKGINEYKLFRLAENLKTIEFRENDLIIKDGPISDKLYIIKSGKVKLVINNIEVKVLEATMSFGDISSQPGAYMRQASFYAKTNIECYYLNKEIFDDVIDYEILKPFNKILMLKDITITLDQLFYIKELGQGSYGKVYLVHDKKRLYAMKTAEIQVMIQNKASAQSYLNEKSIMSSIDHPFMVQLINTFKTREYIFFLMEYIKGSTLRVYLEYKKAHNKFRVINEIVFIGGILCSILSYLQKKRIIHRDLKPDNLMIDQNGYIKAIDFGIAKDLSGKDSTHTLIGTVHYMSPETVSGKNYSFPVDVWSVGVILYEVFYGVLPFGLGMKDPNDIYKDIKERKPVLPYDPKNENVNSFIGSLLDKNPNKRMNCFYKWKSENLFVGMDFDKLNKMELKSPLHMHPSAANTVANTGGGSRGDDDLNNTVCPFHQFIKNNNFCSSNDLEDIENKDVYDYLNDF